MSLKYECECVCVCSELRETEREVCFDAEKKHQFRGETSSTIYLSPPIAMALNRSSDLQAFHPSKQTFIEFRLIEGQGTPNKTLYHKLL